MYVDCHPMDFFFVAIVKSIATQFMCIDANKQNLAFNQKNKNKNKKTA